jgi:hypothetical protein
MDGVLMVQARSRTCSSIAGDAPNTTAGQRACSELQSFEYPPNALFKTVGRHHEML